MIYQVLERSAFTTMQRLHVAGENAVIADVSSITYAVYNAAGTSVASGSLTPADVVFDELQTDSRWTTDDIGYNVRHDIAHTVCTSPEAHTVEYQFTCGATVIKTVIRIKANNTITA